MMLLSLGNTHMMIQLMRTMISFCKFSMTSRSGEQYTGTNYFIICVMLDQRVNFLRGKKHEFKLTNLIPCTCYSLRIKLNSQSPTDWVYFKATTEDEGPFSSVMHISRAIKLGNTSLIRKIAHFRYDIKKIYFLFLFSDSNIANYVQYILSVRDL